MGLRHIFGEFGDWMDNGRTTWAAYRALMSGILIGLNMCPGVRPVSVGENRHRMLVKCMLMVTGAEAKEACGKEQLCGGMEAIIEGGIHMVQLLWKQHA